MKPSGRLAGVAALTLWAILGPCLHAAAQETGVARSADVTPAAGAITVDGRLDEPIWGSAPKIGDLIQRQPSPGERPSERTEVTLLRDDDNLYIGVRAF